MTTVTSYTNLHDPHTAADYPSPFNGLGERMLHPRIAVWSHSRADYQIYAVDRTDWPAIRLTPTNTERTQPFYFADDRNGDAQSRTFTLYRPRARLHSHVPMAIWHTGGWLCRRNREQLVPVLPILAVSDPTKLQWVGNVGLHRDRLDFTEWLTFQTPFHYRPIVHNRLNGFAGAPHDGANAVGDTDGKPAHSTVAVAIPAFVAEALLEKALAAEEMCPISMEPLEKGKTAATSCFHLFHREAIAEWLKTHAECPVCKSHYALTAC